MNSQDLRRFLIFLAIALPLWWLYDTYLLTPMEKRRQAEQERAQAASVAAQKAGMPVGPNGEPIVVHQSRAQALEASPRVQIETPALTGSISLKGARFDDLFLCGSGPGALDAMCYRQTVDKTSPPVELLRPVGADDAYFAVLGWQGASLAGLPDESTQWTAASNAPLTPQHPVELSYSAPNGLAFHRQIAVDAKNLFTITDTVANQGTAAATLAPYGSVQRRDVPPDLGKVNIVHEGAIGWLGGALKEEKYAAWKKTAASKPGGVAEQDASTGGWVGITDKYWMTTFVPPQTEAITSYFKVTQPGGAVDDYETVYIGEPRVVPAGGQASEVTHIFAGAKVVGTLQAYGAALKTPNFDKAVDWGFLEVLTKPTFQLLDFYAGRIANFGLAILALTVTIRLLLFPIFQSSYAMSTKMKKVQPQMKVLQDKYKNDPPGLQKEMMALYQREKINPITGCIPMLLPIPVFYALTKIFTVTIEMRHASFLWIKDLSAADPTTIWNLFGLIPWDPFQTGFVQMLMHLPFVGAIFGMIFHLGLWPIAYGTMMWLTQITGPPMTGMDPTQQRLMRWMPWVFMFFLAQYTVGLVIYWSFSSVFTIAQQYVLMRRYKVENPIDSFFARLTHRGAPSEVKHPGE